MKCPQCGFNNLKDAKFCTSCGHKLDQPVPENGGTNILNPEDVKIVEGDSILNNRFKIIRELGRGGMGDILLAEDTLLKRQVAIKRISDAGLTEKTAKARFLREAQTASRLDHSNICTIYEIYNENDNQYIVMQYIDGITLDQIIKIKKLSIPKIVDIALQICEGMIEAHSHKIIHRDIKPSNIMIDRKGIVKILDFGLAKFDKQKKISPMSENTNITEKGIIMGTVSYMSPEQADGSDIDSRTDVFSFGTVLFEMIDGINPFFSKQKIETMYNVMNKEVALKREVPEDVSKIVTKSITKEKKKRYQNFDEIKSDLIAAKKRLAEGGESDEDLAAEPHTEVINTDDNFDLFSGSKPTSDNEGLGEIVSRIKKYKRSTEKVTALSMLKNRRKFLYVFFGLVWLAATFYFVVLKGTLGSGNSGKTTEVPIERKEKCLKIEVVLDEDSKSKKLFTEKIKLLFESSLNQYNGFYIISDEKNIKISRNAYDFYLFRSKVSIKKDTYTIDASLILEGKEVESFTKSTTSGTNSILSYLIHSVSGDLVEYFQRFNDGITSDLKNVSNFFGSDWKRFSVFYKGLSNYRKLDSEKAAKLLKKTSDILISKYYLANVYFFRGDQEDALKVLKSLLPDLDKFSDSIRYRILALKARLEFDFKVQLDYLKKLKEKFPFSKEVYFELGEAYFHHGQADDAITNYLEAISFDENYSQAINHLGYCYAYKGEHDNALKQFKTYRKKDDESPNSLDSLGDGYFYKGKFYDAIQLKRAAINLSEGEVSWAYLTISDIYVLQAHYGNALQALEKYKDRLKKLGQLSEKEQCAILTKKAYIMYKMGDTDSALQLCNEGLKIHDTDKMIDNNSETHWVKGILLLEADRLAEAESELAYFVNLVKKYDISENNYYQPFKYYLHLKAKILEKKGDLEAAESCYRQLIRLKTQLSYWITYFNYQFFHTEYIKMLRRHGKLKLAMVEVDRCLSFADGYIPVLWEKADILDARNDSQNPSKPVYQLIDRLYRKFEPGQQREENLLMSRLMHKLGEKNDKNDSDSQ